MNKYRIVLEKDGWYSAEKYNWLFGWEYVSGTCSHTASESEKLLINQRHDKCIEKIVIKHIQIS
jgi:hypothetical protein